MRLLRKIVFYLFLLVYLIACPLIILYALGYTFRPGAKEEVVKTGLISLATTPPGASVYVEGRRYTERTPAVLRDLLPGTYHLKLLLKGHQPWSGTVSVEAEKAIALENVLLLPTIPAQHTVLSETFETLTPLPATPFILLAKGRKLGDLVVYDWKTGAHWPLLPVESPLTDGKISSTVIVKDSPVVLLRSRFSDGQQVLRVELRKGEARLTDLTKLFPAAPLWIEWDPRMPRQLFTFQEGSVNRLDVDAMAIYPAIAKGIRGYGIANNALYVLTDDLAFQRMDGEGKHLTTLFDDPVAGSELFGERGLFRIHVLDDALTLFLGERGELIVSQLPQWPGRLMESGIRGFEADPQRQRLLLWRKDRLGLFDYSNAPEEDRIGDADHALRWAFEEGRDIAQAFWVYGGSYLLFRDGQTVSLLECEPSSGANPVQRVLQVRPGSAIAYSDDSGTLYYLDRLTGRLMAMQMLPEKPLLPFPLPGAPTPRSPTRR